jgi:hypothetical protein
MRVVLYPFFSQQDKQRRKFRLLSDSGVKLYVHLAKQLRARGHDVAIVSPPSHQCSDCIEVPDEIEVLEAPELELDNLLRRLQWNPSFLQSLECDVLLTQHEFLAYPMKCIHGLRPKVVMECGIRPFTAYPETAEMFRLSHRAADAIHFNSRTLADETQHPRKFVWSFGYDEDVTQKRDVRRDIDVLFPARASATRYTNHHVFVQAMQDVPLSVIMTDPTGYLHATQECPLFWLDREPLSRNRYLETLWRSRVVVSLTANGYGGWAFREAIVAGCIPVCPDLLEYREFLPEDWPYFVEDYRNPEAVRRVVLRALQDGRPCPMTPGMQASAYRVAAETAIRDVESL